jgi:hypothetical protein
MKRLIASIAKALHSFQIERFFATALTICLLMTTGMNVSAAPERATGEALGQNIRERIAETDHSDRPKTTGEFLDEARGDVPLDQRAKNITRDSVEAFKELGKEYTPDVKAGARNLRDGAADALR